MWLHILLAQMQQNFWNLQLFFCKIWNCEKIYTMTYGRNLEHTIRSILKPMKFIAAQFPFKHMSHLCYKLNDSIDPDLMSNVIYRVSCKDCDSLYLGQFKQYLKNRLYHIGKNNLVHLALCQHVTENNHQPENREILHQCEPLHQKSIISHTEIDKKGSFYKYLII